MEPDAAAGAEALASVLGPRLRDAAAAVPDDVELITVDCYYERFERLVEQMRARGIPAELEYLEPSDAGRPILHVKIGNGRHHHVSSSGVHPNESHSLVADLYEAEWWLKNPDLLAEHDLTVHFVCVDPDGLALAEAGTAGEPDLLRYVEEGGYRSVSGTTHAAWGFPIQHGDYVFDQPGRGVRAMMQVVDAIYAAGEHIVSLRSGHNHHVLYGDLWFFAYGPFLAQLAQRLEAAAQARGLEVREVLADSEPHPVRGTRSVFAMALAEALLERGHQIGDSERGYILKAAAAAGEDDAVVISGIEVAKWAVADEGAWGGVRQASAAAVRDARIAPLLPLFEQGEAALAAHGEGFPEDLEHPLIEAALSFGPHALKPTWNMSGGGAADPERNLTPAQHFQTEIGAPFIQAVRAGQLIRALEAAGIEADLRDTLRTEMRRVVECIRPHLRTVSLAAAIRAQVDAGLTTLDHALASAAH